MKKYPWIFMCLLGSSFKSYAAGWEEMYYYTIPETTIQQRSIPQRFHHCPPTLVVPYNSYGNQPIYPPYLYHAANTNPYPPTPLIPCQKLSYNDLFKLVEGENVTESFLEEWIFAMESHYDGFKKNDRFTSCNFTRTLYSLTKIKDLNVAKRVLKDNPSWIGRWFDETEFLFRKLKTHRPQNFSNILYALALLEITPPQKWINSFFKASLKKLPFFNDQNFANVIYGISKLGMHVPEEWMFTFFNASGPQLCDFSSRSLAGTIYGLSKSTKSIPPEWIKAFIDASILKLGRFTPQEFSNTIDALASFHIKPKLDWLQTFLNVVFSKLSVLEERDVTTIINSISTLDLHKDQRVINLFEINCNQACQEVFKSGDVECAKKLLPFTSFTIRQKNDALNRTNAIK